MKPSYRIYPGEIAAKGKGYLVLQSCRGEEADELLRRGREELLGLGATELYVTSHVPAAPLEEGTRAGCRLVHARDMLWMERGLEPPQEPIREQTTQAPARGRSIYRKRRAAEIVVPREEESLLVAMAM